MTTVARPQRLPLQQSKTAPAGIPQLPQLKPLEQREPLARHLSQEITYPTLLRPHIQTRPSQQHLQPLSQQQQQQPQQQVHDSPITVTTAGPVTPPAGVALGIPNLFGVSGTGAGTGAGAGTGTGAGENDRGTPPQKPPPYSAYPQPQPAAQMYTLSTAHNHSPTQSHSLPAGAGTSPTARKMLHRVPVPVPVPGAPYAQQKQQAQGNELKELLSQTRADLFREQRPPGLPQSSPTAARAPPPAPIQQQQQQRLRHADSWSFPSTTSGSPELAYAAAGRGHTPPSAVLQAAAGRGHTPPAPALRRIPPRPLAPSLLPRRDTQGHLPSPTEAAQAHPAPAGPRARTISISNAPADPNYNSSSSTSTEERTTPTYHTAYTSLPSAPPSESGAPHGNGNGNMTDYSEPFAFDRPLDPMIQARLIGPRTGSGSSGGSGSAPARGTPEQPVDDRDDAEEEHLPSAPSGVPSSSEGTENNVVRRYMLSDTPPARPRELSQVQYADSHDSQQSDSPQRPSGNSQSLPDSSAGEGGPDMDYLEMETPRSVPSALPAEGDFVSPGGGRYNRQAGFSWPAALGAQGRGWGPYGPGEAFGVFAPNAPSGHAGSNGQQWNGQQSQVVYDPRHGYPYGSMYDMLNPTAEVSSLDGILMGYEGSGASDARAREEAEGRMAQPLPKHPFAFRDLDVQMQMRAQVAQMAEDMPLPRGTWNGEHDIPTREQSVAPSFEGNMDALMHYIGRPPAPIPPTPFTQTGGTPANDPHFRRDDQGDMPPLPEYSYPLPLFPHQPGPMTDSTVSSPYGGNPFLPYHVLSMQSTPSVANMPLDNGILRSRLSGLGGRPGQTHPAYSHMRPPSSVSGESAEPQDTESEGEEDDDDVWEDEASDDELDDEFHRDYIPDKATRRTRFESKMRALVRQFRELDRSTDATMLLIASNPDQRHTHLVLSRGVRRHPHYIAFANSARQSFSQVADSRRAERSSRSRMIQHQQRPTGMRRKPSGFIMSSIPTMSHAQDRLAETTRSGSTTSGNTSSTGTSQTGSGTASSMTSLTPLDHLLTLKSIDANKMSAQEFRTAVMTTLSKMEAAESELRQHAQAQHQQPDSTEEMQKRLFNQWQAAGLTGRAGADLLLRTLQADSGTDVTGANGSEIR
ncbi:hypothetical protein CALVIDRAFT_561382 [Calocera viscosa TUFC12733]|uniref:Uncharacterized protein n=1 Tax=Calocera viscosa (strain TUFC12733) TaxID=1330018 RepID=A0A167Q8Q9_CALVF|nr:hypothetical protein CALVIDRAFT_561382 [Calocera viscosa TUFC12733]